MVFLPFDWMKDGSEKSWLTKTTEENYYKLLNDKWYQFDYYVDHTPNAMHSRRYRLAEMLRRNDRLLAEKVYRNELEKAAVAYETSIIPEHITQPKLVYIPHPTE